MSYEKPENETEILSADERKLRAMCLSLKRVEAPKDFDFKLKARLAGSKARDFQPRFGVAFRYALPAFALILILGLLAYNSGFLSSPGTEIIAGSTVPPLPQNSAVSAFAPLEKIEETSENTVAAAPKVVAAPDRTFSPANEVKPSKAKRIPVVDEKDSGGGSKVFSSTQIKTRQPNSIASLNSPQKPSNDQSSNAISLKDVFSINGINAAFENGKWVVKSAKGRAESAGFKENDVIEAIENQALAGENFNGKTIGGKSFTVVRDGKKIIITLPAP